MTGERVLVIDDDAEIRCLVRLVLERAGFAVTTADEGTSALELLAGGGRPDIALLDVNMPGMDGWETLARLRRDPCTSELPVVMCTALGSPDDLHLGWSLGCDGYLAKPFGIAELVAQIRSVLALGPTERDALRRARMSQYATANRTRQPGERA